MSSLPSEIITNILIRLPVKSLLRFRCVSKPWRDEIDCPYFIKLHLTHSISTGANHSPITEGRDLKTPLYSIDSDSLEKLEKIVTPFISRSWVYNTCNGLLILNAGNDLVLFNPSTRKQFVVPTPPPENNYPNVSFVESWSCLGYDIINDDYKVFIIHLLVIMGLEFDSYEFDSYEAQIYSLKSNLWHTVKDFTKGIEYDCDFEVYVNGALHNLDHNGSYYTIAALDVGKEDFSLIPMPNVDDNKKVKQFGVHVFDGRLAVSGRYPGGRTDIWVMKEYGVKESWIMLLSVKPDYLFPLVRPMVYSKSRTEVLLSYHRHKLVWFDLRKKTVREFPVSGVPKGFGWMVCVESLVSVGGNGKIDDKKKQHGEEKMKAGSQDEEGFELKL